MDRRCAADFLPESFFTGSLLAPETLPLCYRSEGSLFLNSSRLNHQIDVRDAA